MKRIMVSEITAFLVQQGYPFSLVGNAEISIESFSPLSALTDASVTWIKKWTPEIEGQFQHACSEDVLVVCPEEALIHNFDLSGCCFLCTDEPKMLFFEILDHFFVKKTVGESISLSAKVYSKCVGRNCVIGDNSVISDETVIGDDVVIGCNVTTIGRVIIGNHCKIQSGTVIGEAGFGYYTLPNGHNKQVPHLGGVVLEDYVEIGSNTCIDRGTMGDTTIGAHTKIDNLVHVGHNVIMGKDCTVIAGVVLGGSSVLEDGAYIAPGAIIKNQIRVKKGTLVGMQALVTKDTEEGVVLAGVPAKPLQKKV